MRLSRTLIGKVASTSFGLAFCVGNASAIEIYSTNFSSPVGAEWSATKRTTSPSGQIFLGDFANDDIRLELTNLPEHTAISISLDLYILRSMDGNSGDYWKLSVIDGPVLLDSTFSNPLRSGGGPSQSYPDNYPAVNPAQTGASAVNSLGYNSVSNGYINPSFGDSTYRLDYNFAHVGDSVVFSFCGSDMEASLLPTSEQPGTPSQVLLDEAWGIDNVSVSLENQPLPAGGNSFVMFAMAAGIFFTIRSHHARRWTDGTVH